MFSVTAIFLLGTGVIWHRLMSARWHETYEIVKPGLFGDTLLTVKVNLLVCVSACLTTHPLGTRLEHTPRK
jgi:hypothetical protein